MHYAYILNNKLRRDNYFANYALISDLELYILYQDQGFLLNDFKVNC